MQHPVMLYQSIQQILKKTVSNSKKRAWFDKNFIGITANNILKANNSSDTGKTVLRATAITTAIQVQAPIQENFCVQKH